MIDEINRKSLIQYRLEQAKETISEARLLIDNVKYRAAVNRIYYGMFYSLLALGSKFHFTTSKHGQLIGWFNKNFIKDKKIDRKFGKIINDAFKARRQGDYDAYTEFSKDDVLERFENMKEFIGVVEQAIEAF